MNIRAKIWLKDIGATCPICGEDLEHLCDERNEGKYEDSYTCDACGVIVTYISPDDGRQYHEYRNGEIEVSFELRAIGGTR